MTTGTHAHTHDARNETILISINGELKSRSEAMVSVFDSGFILGDGVWEGLRLHRGIIAFLQEHMDRLYEGATAIDLDIGMPRESLIRELYRTIDANQMESGVHIRLMVTRGLKKTPFQGTSANVGGPTVVIIPEWKDPDPGLHKNGIRLFTVHVRRGRPDVQDPVWNSHSKLNCVTACIQAEKAGVDEGLMLDPQGFVATCNSTHFFVVRKGELWTSTGRYCLHGITRANVLRLARESGRETREKDFSLTQVYSANEAFCTGTFAGLMPVIEVDGRKIGDGTCGPVTTELQSLYEKLIHLECSSPRRMS
ncbi:MAG: aminotransferase class IV [Planctomycetota bacterium]|nr:aminotransferase class IV [Planctomycetota bacterium]